MPYRRKVVSVAELFFGEVSSDLKMTVFGVFVIVVISIVSIGNSDVIIIVVSVTLLFVFVSVYIGRARENVATFPPSFGVLAAISTVFSNVVISPGGALSVFIPTATTRVVVISFRVVGSSRSSSLMSPSVRLSAWRAGF